MKTTIFAAVCCALLVAFGVAGSSMADDDDRGRMDLTGAPALVKGDPDAFLAQALEGVTVPVDSLFGNDAGCVNPRLVFPDYVVAGVGDAEAGECQFTRHDFAMNYAYYESDSDDARGFVSGSGGSFAFSCDNGARTVIDFAAGATYDFGTGSCTTSSATPPTGNWYGYCWFGPIKCVYSDNVADIAYHILN